MIYHSNDRAIEVKLCSAANPETGEREIGLLYHDCKDKFHDGDGVIFGYYELPEDCDDVFSIVSNEYLFTDSEVLDTVDGINNKSLI